MGEYDPKSIEPKWQAYWEKERTFTTKDTGKDKVYVLDMFPYPSGAGLHMGHPLGYTGTDIYSRFKRMKGFSVLHPMGFDAFGLPAEQHAVATGEHPAIITEKNCETFVRQMKEIGFSYDWDREIKTCTPDYYGWTQWIFLKLYNSWFDEEAQKARPIEELPIPEQVKKEGLHAVQAYQAEHRLAYYADAMVNWCPALGTVLANEEVIDGKSERGGHDVIRKPMKQWMLRITKYSERLISELEGIDWPEAIKEQQRNWIGKKTGTEITFALKEREEAIVAFTTRPDTLFGVTFFVIAPEHPLVATITTPECEAAVTAYREAAARLSDFDRTYENRKKTGVFTGGYVVNPINGESVPVYVGDYVLISYGTGAVMGVPAHDARDFEFARSFKIPVRAVVAPPASEPAKVHTAVQAGEMAWTDPGSMLPNDAPVAQELGLDGKANREAGDLITSWLVAKGLGNRVVNYKLRDWLFSRQRYWGEPIPIVHWEDGTTSAVPESELPLILPRVEDYKPSESGESPLAKAKDWLDVVDPATGKRGRRETNTMPQWAGSCWYYLRFIDPRNPNAPVDRTLEKRWMPVDLYVGGAEHAVLHLLYARFWHKVLFDLGVVSTREPFKKLYNQGMLLAHAYKDARGALIPTDQVDEDDTGARNQKTGEKLERIVAKMSKSLRNVINPDDVIAQYGADTLRVYLMFMGPLDAARPWDSKAITGSNRFLKRIYSLITGNSETGIRDVVPENAEPVEVKRAINKAILKVGEDIDGLRFNTGISTMMELLNTLWDKPLSRDTLEKFVLILSPFAPHVAEELWERLGKAPSASLAPWPEYDPALIKDDVVTVVIQVGGKKRATIDVAPTIADSDLKAAVIAAMATTAYPASEKDRFITVYNTGTTVPRLVNVIPQ